MLKADWYKTNRKIDEAEFYGVLDRVSGELTLRKQEVKILTKEGIFYVFTNSNLY